jgi:MYXO-CTERM domain-containing protein
VISRIFGIVQLLTPHVMKIPSLLAMAAISLASQLHAFTIDFASLLGVSLPPDQTITVLGYGSVRLSAGTSGGATTPVEVGTIFGSPALQFTSNEVINIEFLDGTLTDFSIAAIGQGVGENFALTSTTPNQYRIQLSGSGAAAGIQSISFSADAVPEPAAASLGLIGLAGIVLRRRR